MYGSPPFLIYAKYDSLHASLFICIQQDDCPSASRLQLYDFIRSLQDSFTAIESYPWPVIAAVQGGVIGGGVDLIAACDVRLCSSDASFCVKEVDVGIVADLGTLQRLPPIVGYGRAAELALTARKFSANEALSMGLVSEVLDSHEALHQRALELAKSLAAKPPLALRGTKRFLLDARDHTVSEGLKNIATYNMGVLASHELRDKLRAFVGAGAAGQGQRQAPRAKL